MHISVLNAGNCMKSDLGERVFEYLSAKLYNFNFKAKLLKEQCKPLFFSVIQ